MRKIFKLKKAVIVSLDLLLFRRIRFHYESFEPIKQCNIFFSLLTYAQFHGHHHNHIYLYRFIYSSNFQDKFGAFKVRATIK